jgi:PIN domain nuclease of toxin-antitoxin system
VRLLADTHIMIWLAEGHEQLPDRSRRILDECAVDEGIAVSAISFCETGMLQSKGRIAISLPIRKWRALVLDVDGISEIPVTGEIGIEVVGLPPGLHSDPADRLIVATARLHGLTLRNARSSYPRLRPKRTLERRGALVSQA